MTRSEARTITVTAYRDGDGEPTCCAHWDTARCRFITVRKFGLVEVCAATGEDLQRKDGFLRPSDDCPVWGSLA